MGQGTISVHWVCTMKMANNRKIVKARLVTRDFEDLDADIFVTIYLLV